MFVLRKKNELVDNLSKDRDKRIYKDKEKYTKIINYWMIRKNKAIDQKKK